MDASHTEIPTATPDSPTPMEEGNRPPRGNRQVRVSIIPPQTNPNRRSTTPTHTPVEEPASGNTRREGSGGRTGRMGLERPPNSASLSVSKSAPLQEPTPRRASSRRSSDSPSRYATPEAVRKRTTSSASASLTSSMRKKDNTISPRRSQSSAKSGTTRRSDTSAFSPSSSLRRASMEMRRRKLRKSINVLAASEDKARAKIDTQYHVEWVNMMQIIALNSFDAHRRFIMELEEIQRKTRHEYGSRAERAEETAAKLTNAINHLLESVHVTGAKALEEVQLLETEIPFSTPTYTPVAETLPCALDPSSLLQESYVPVKLRDPREPEEIAKIESFFRSFMRPTGVQATSSNNNGTRESSSPGASNEGVLSSTLNVDVNSVLSNADEAYAQTLHLSGAFAALIDRTHRGLQQSREMIRALQQTLNENFTRVKVADDLMRETIEKHRVEVDSAIGLCGQFGMELRRRMDAIEKHVRDALAELIERSTEVSIKNNAFYDQAQLLLNKESAFWHNMSCMEKATVEQGKLLRDVRLKLLELWKERCGGGDEERATLKHSGLPTEYHTALELCDRDTLLRMLHFVALNGDGASELLVGALDERANFFRSNTAEAQALLERCATRVAVTELLEKLYEEGEIRCNPRHHGETLPEIIREMVLHYNTYMELQDKQQRRMTKIKSVTHGVDSTGSATTNHVGFTATRPAFFDRRTPVPEEYAADIASCPSLKSKRPAICDGNAYRNVTDDATNQNVYNTPLPIIKAQVDCTNSGAANISNSPQQIETCHILSYLQRSHPSELDPPGTATIVGYGRWGGKIAKHSDDNSNNNNNNNNNNISKKCQFLRMTSSHVGVHQLHGPIPNPPPGVPPRKTIMRHMLEGHCHDVETLLRNPKMQCRCIRGEDELFLPPQRELSGGALS